MSLQTIAPGLTTLRKGTKRNNKWGAYTYVPCVIVPFRSFVRCRYPTDCTRTQSFMRQLLKDPHWPPASSYHGLSALQCLKMDESLVRFQASQQTSFLLAKYRKSYSWPWHNGCTWHATWFKGRIKIVSSLGSPESGRLIFKCFEYPVLVIKGRIQRRTPMNKYTSFCCTFFCWVSFFSQGTRVSESHRRRDILATRGLRLCISAPKRNDSYMPTTATCEHTNKGPYLTI